ncbi:Hpt domain-containing protein [Stakelama sp. CBK3Z-3]|uniref:Hpt domain-containing protein n=1 Tax=Stakelama flava TaxID=2860338 RepID=A0ABS6XKE8_9SPHN|nr:Hpt domain-containing protein [Stakelama flava]MBW4329851.1 Hpt domain-containing protein [Stakelama flava]
MQGAYQEDELLDRAAFEQARSELGANFVRIVGYFREDGEKSLIRIEEAGGTLNAAALVLPAHTLKGEARQLGAELLADLAETIEMIGRECVEQHDDPSEAIEHIARLRSVFRATLETLESAASPLMTRRPGFGRRVAPSI